LSMNPPIKDSIHHILLTDWRQLLLPYEYEPGRYYWPTAVIPFVYAAQEMIGPLFAYMFFSSLLVVTSFVVASLLGASILFSSTLSFMFGFGAQLDYVFVFGNII